MIYGYQTFIFQMKKIPKSRMLLLHIISYELIKLEILFTVRELQLQ